MADGPRFPNAEQFPGNIADALAFLDKEETTRIIDSIADGLFTVDRQLVIPSISRRFQT